MILCFEVHRCVYLNDVVSERSVKLDVGEQPGVVAGAEAGLDYPLAVAEDVELGQRHVWGHLHRLLTVLPPEFQVYCAKHSRIRKSEINTKPICMEEENKDKMEV